MLAILFTATLFGSNALRAAEAITPDLQKLANGRNVQWIAAAKGKSALQVKDLVWLEDVTFANGTIEIDILGKSAPPRRATFLASLFAAWTRRPVVVAAVF